MNVASTSGIKVRANGNGMSDSLTTADVKRLLNDPSAVVREELATKLARHFNQGKLSAAERQLAEDIFRTLARSAAERVRRALSENLKDNPTLPADVALTLARDIDRVALPILECSMVLSDADLIAIVRDSGVKKQLAIARRATVSAAVSEALVESDRIEVLSTLLENEGAALLEPQLMKMLDRHAKQDDVQMPMARRGVLPATVLERLVAQASLELSEILIARNDIPPRLARVLAIQVREDATVELLPLGTPTSEIAAFVAHLRLSGRLSPSLLIRAMCSGDLVFVEVAFSILAGVPLRNAKLLLHDIGLLGFHSLFERSGMEKALLPLFRSALNIVFDEPFEGGEDKRDWYRRRTVQRLLQQFEHVGAGDLDYLVEKILEDGAVGQKLGA